LVPHVSGTEPVTLAVIAGLVVGKPVGLVGATWLGESDPGQECQAQPVCSERNDHVRIAVLLGSLAAAALAPIMLRIRNRPVSDLSPATSRRRRPSGLVSRRAKGRLPPRSSAVVFPGCQVIVRTRARRSHTYASKKQAESRGCEDCVRHVTDGGCVRGELPSDQSSCENRSLEPAFGAVDETGSDRHHPRDPALHAAADVERLLADAPALRRIVDLACEVEPENIASAGEASGMSGNHHAPPPAGHQR